MLFSSLKLLTTANTKKNNKRYKIIPRTLVVATHNDIMVSPEQLFSTVLHNNNIRKLCNTLTSQNNNSIHLSLSTRFIKLTDYVHSELGRLLQSNQDSLQQTQIISVGKSATNECTYWVSQNKIGKIFNTRFGCSI